MPDLLSIVGLDELIPEQYAAYRPLINDAAFFFLSSLEPSRREAILAEQTALPPRTSPAARLTALLHHCPTLHKLAQVTARDRRLPPDLRRHLQQLESFPPRATVARVLGKIAAATGDSPEVTVATEAIAEASVALVVPFQWRRREGTRDGVLKVLKPHIRDHVAEELEIWPRLGARLEERAAEYGLPEVPYREILESVRELLLQEIRLGIEQSHLREAAALYRGRNDVLIPELLPFCTDQVTAMERVYGQRVTSAELAPGERRRLAETTLDALAASPFWQPEGDSLFHADPHAGNLWRTPDGRLAVLDWSLAARLPKTAREATVQLVLGGVTLQPERIATGLAALATRVDDVDALARLAHQAAGEVLHGRFPGCDWLLDLVDGAALSGAVRFPREQLLFRKSLLMLEGVVRDIHPDVTLYSVLLSTGLRAFSVEAASRLFTAPGSRRFATHLSNLDLWRLSCDLTSAPLCYWAGVWSDLARERRLSPALRAGAAAVN